MSEEHTKASIALWVLFFGKTERAYFRRLKEMGINYWALQSNGYCISNDRDAEDPEGRRIGEYVCYSLTDKALKLLYGDSNGRT